MFPLIKKLFKRKPVKTFQLSQVNKSATPISASSATTRDEGGDFATSYMVGMATNNAVLGGLVGGSMAGGLMGDIARDGVIGERVESCREDSGIKQAPQASASMDCTTTHTSSSSDSGSSDSSSGGE